MKTPLIFEIKENALDDGPGIRSVVFFRSTAFIKTILFGFTCWLALKQGIIEK
jgi:hypothetical protein